MSNIGLFGRKKELKRLASITKSKKSEFIAIYGRRRVGKTFLVKEFFNYKFDFYITGLSNAETSQQLFNFDNALSNQSSIIYQTPSRHWLEAFQRLIKHIENIRNKDKKVIFIDELPWFDTHGSDFLTGIEHFWNSWATNRKDVILVVCGSAASWMVNELINHSGGLHNRVTQHFKILPFTLNEAEQMLRGKNCVFDRYQIIQLYMCLGGIPYYLDLIDSSLSSSLNIQEMLFEKGGKLENEFYNLYRSLFKKYEAYEKVVEILSRKNAGMQRSEIISNSEIKSGGTLSKILQDLEESGFIASYVSMDGRNKNIIYRLSDYYTKFYFHFVKDGKNKMIDNWTNYINQPAYEAWQGFTFEQICLDHIIQIKKSLGIGGIHSYNASWSGRTEKKGIQIDLLIDRNDRTINLCECKFSISEYTINKNYADTLRSKIALFKELTNTKKSIHLTFITTYGLNENQYSEMLVQNQVMMDDLFLE